ncbi:Cytochrome c1 heme lyase [Agyrium rufum]|nr:Cytochrome c1 heme lyase [Agyrium rufum]
MADQAKQSPPSACPVDPAAREAWLRQAKQGSASASSSNTSTTLPPHELPPPPSDTADHPLRPPTHQRPPKIIKHRPLADDREVSNIPRASTAPLTTTPSPASPPANSQSESPADPHTGNWIYPSEKMFFEAMKRKSYNPEATDMASIVPIHNAVNERAWSEIKGWERAFGWARKDNEQCGGPRLRSFRGDSKKWTPRAWWNVWVWGYREPFDRHDWVVERCGREVEYVIDFYEGRGGSQRLNFFLDVRPKLNSWEGWKMRMGRFVGLG